MFLFAHTFTIVSIAILICYGKTTTNNNNREKKTKKQKQKTYKVGRFMWFGLKPTFIHENEEEFPLLLKEIAS